MLQTITPFRQLARAYASLLSGSSALTQLSAEAKRCAERGGEIELAITQQFHEAVKSLPRVEIGNIALYQRMGLTLLLDRKSLVDYAVIEHGEWEAPQVSYLTGLIKESLKTHPVTFLDLGSYWGLYSLMAMRAGVQTIHAFDADRHNFAQLQSQVFLNNAAGVINCHWRAISNKNGTIPFWDSRTHPDGNRGGVGVVQESDPRANAEVPCVRLDDYLPLSGQFIVAKMDLESHETEALQGMVNLFANNKVILQVEIYDEHMSSRQPILEQLGLRQIHRIGYDHYLTNF